MDPSPSAAGLHVLVIEDDPDTRANLRDILELDEHVIRAAGSVGEVLRQTEWKDLDVVILDRRLPDGSAEELLPVLKERAPDADVIVVTGYADLEGAIQALRRGAADYILKPINPDVLRASIARTAEKRRLSRAREQSESAFRTLVETAECLIVIARHDGRLAYINPFAEQTSGCSAGEALGRDMFELLIPEHARSDFRTHVLASVAAGRLRSREAALLGANGRKRWVLWNARPLAEYEGQPAVLLIGLDITERRQAEQKALQSERLAAIGQMVTGLAHESRNALQRSQACLEMLALDLEDRPDALGLVQRIQRAQDHLHHLYEEVRGYAAPIALRRVSCPLSELVQATWSHLEVFRKQKRVRISQQLLTADDRCFVDRDAVERVFRNILENSIAACPEPGEISVTFEDVELDGLPAIQAAFRDNGPGLSPEQAARIFEPFFTTKTEGTGLGMAIVKRIIEAHAGQILVGPSRPGAEIIVRLPRGRSVTHKSAGSGDIA